MTRTLAQYIRIGLFFLGIFRFFIQDSMAESYSVFRFWWLLAAHVRLE